MSIVSSAHDVALYVSGKSMPLEGQRLAVIGFKGRKDKEGNDIPAPKSSCVSVPHIELSDEMAIALKPYLVGLLNETQDKIIRAKILDGAQVITNQDISIDACIEFLDAEGSSGRLTKEAVVAWFDAKLSVPLVSVLEKKLGIVGGIAPTPAQAKTLNLTVNSFKDTVSSLTGGKTLLPKERIEQVKKVFALLPSEDEADVIANRLIGRLLDIEKKMESDMDIGILAL